MAGLIRAVRCFNTATLPLALLLSLTACTIPSRIDSIIVNDAIATGVSGDVKLFRGDEVLDTAAGTAIEIGDRIVTGANAKAVLLLENGQVEVVLLEDTEVRISSLFLAFGEIYVRIKDNFSGVFEVPSVDVVASPEGTEFVVKVPRAGESGVVYQCVVLEGRVRVRPATSQAWRPVLLNAKEEVTLTSAGQSRQRTLNRRDYNAWIKRVNEVEALYRPNAAQLIVPDAVGLTAAVAGNLLRSHNLTVGTVEPEVTGKVQIGQVARLVPGAGERVSASQKVDLFVEAEPTNVPRVTGMTLEDAKRSLRRARLSDGNVSERITGDVKAGLVQDQQPNANERVPVGSTVDLWVEAESVKVPSVINQTESRARELLRNAQLRVGRTRESTGAGQIGRVTAQNPNAGKRVKPNSAVDITVEKTCTVPNIAGQPESTAKATVRAAGLVPRVSQRKRYGDAASGPTPKANTKVRCNTEVSFVVGTDIG